MSKIAIIPARSGSKGLKDKNIKELNGKPLMAYSIEAAINSKLFDCVHVSTDSEQYAQIARQYGAEVLFLRPAELSGDKTSSWDAVRFVLDEYEKRGRRYDELTLLQPTSPLRTSNDIKNAYQIYHDRKAKAVISVCEMDHSPLSAETIASDGNMKGFAKKEYCDRPRQALPIYYRVNGAIYIVKIECLNDIAELYNNECYAYIMKKECSVDIDDEMDFIVAEAILHYYER